jgi:hypothetical protein
MSAAVGLQIVEGHLELCSHVARMLGVTVGVHRVLSAANEQPLVPLDELGPIESQVGGPRHGVDWRSFHVLLLELALSDQTEPMASLIASRMRSIAAAPRILAGVTMPHEHFDLDRNDAGLRSGNVTAPRGAMRAA